MADPASNPPPVSHMRTYASDVAALTGKPLPKNVQNEPAPVPPPPPPPPAYIIPKAPTTNESKEDVLARLKTKAAVAPSAPAPAPSKEAVLTRLKTTVPVPPPGIPPVAKPAPAERVHTYKSDFSEHAKESGATRISMVAAQADAPRAPAPLTKEKPNTAVFLAGGLLILAGVGAVYAAYRFAMNPAIPQATVIPSLIFADERVRLSGSAEELRTALASGSDADLSDGEVAVTYLSYATTTEDGVVERVATGAELIEALRLPAPAVLLRAVEPASTVGFMRQMGETRPFLILRVDSYERSFAGMLDWEATIERDLALFYPAHPVEAPPVATSTATSTTPLPPPPPFRLSFVDEVIGNRDVRILKDADNRSVMVYGYRDKETLILTRSPEAFLELLERLATTRGE